LKLHELTRGRGQMAIHPNPRLTNREYQLEGVPVFQVSVLR